MRQIKVLLPAEELGTDPEEVVRMVTELTDRRAGGGVRAGAVPGSA
jgi:hypothetical protein